MWNELPIPFTERHHRSKTSTQLQIGNKIFYLPCNRAQWVSYIPRSCGRKVPGSRVCSMDAPPSGCSDTRSASYRSSCMPDDPCGSSDPLPLYTLPKISTENTQIIWFSIYVFKFKLNCQLPRFSITILYALLNWPDLDLPLPASANMSEGQDS